MKWGYEIFGKSFEEHLELSKSIYEETKNRFDTGTESPVSIEEKTVEEHIESNWGKGVEDDRNYHDETDNWKKGKKLREPTLIVSGSGEKTYMLDTFKAVIGRPEDTFYFHMVQACAAVVIEFDSPDGQILRFAYHLDDQSLLDEGCLPALVQQVSMLGNPKKLTIFYNSYPQGSRAENHILALNTPESISKEVVDMSKIFDWAAHDIFVQGNEATLYHNEGDYNLETDTATVRRVKSGEHIIL